MPGSSLWLLPPVDHSIDGVLTTLIDKTSVRFASKHRFLPHVTLTSEISSSTYDRDPQKWLDALSLPAGNEIQVSFEQLNSEDVFVRKLYIKCNATNSIKQLAQQCRRQVSGFETEENARQWVEEKFNPHLSLL